MSFATWGAVPAPEKPDAAALGRATWTVLHAMADTTEESASGLSKFVSAAAIVIDRYPCLKCRRSAHHACGKLIGTSTRAHSSTSLRRLHERAQLFSYRTVAVAWAARMHACVTTHLLGSNKTRDGVSAESRLLAEAVLSMREDDVAIDKFMRG